MKAIILSLPKLFKSFRQRKKISSASEQNPHKNNPTGFYDLTATDISGQKIDLSRFRGKKTLVVNVASECGYTYQYEQLEALSKEKSGQLNILGFPSNDFGGQEPGTPDEISNFCQLRFGVTFPLFQKSGMTSNSMNEVYRWLSDPERNGWNEELPSWNFCKYLIDENGKLCKFYGSAIEPMGEEILSQL